METQIKQLNQEAFFNKGFDDSKFENFSTSHDFSQGPGWRLHLKFKS